MILLKLDLAEDLSRITTFLHHKQAGQVKDFPRADHLLNLLAINSAFWRL